MKKCTKCLNSKPETEFAIKYAQKNHYHGICKSCHSQYTKKWYQANKEKHKARVAKVNKRKMQQSKELIRSAKNVPCKDCGKSYPPYVMDFDHLDQKSKIFCVSTAGRGRIKMQNIINEISKCEVVCANCHRERTFKHLVGRAGDDPA